MGRKRIFCLGLVITCVGFCNFQEGPVLVINTASNLLTGYFSRSRFGNTPGIDRASEGYLSMEQRENYVCGAMEGTRRTKAYTQGPFD